MRAADSKRLLVLGRRLLVALLILVAVLAGIALLATRFFAPEVAALTGISAQGDFDKLKLVVQELRVRGYPGAGVTEVEPGRFLLTTTAPASVVDPLVEPFGNSVEVVSGEIVGQ